jgi:UDP-N-acetylglucosamine acyltransferase
VASIHATAIVEPGAELAGDVEVGAYSIVRAKVRIGAGSVVGPHCVIEGRTTIGRDNRISQFNAIGGVPQDKKYGGEDTTLEIGDRNTIREFCSIHIGTVQDAGVTRIGDDNWIMNHVHIAHDCQSATRRSSPATRAWPAMCSSATGRSSAARAGCCSSFASARTR